MQRLASPIPLWPLHNRPNGPRTDDQNSTGRNLYAYLATRHRLRRVPGQPTATRLVPRKARPEVAQRGAKRLQITSDKIQLPILLMNYKTPGLVQIKQAEPPIEEWEVYALDVLAATLDGGASARFARVLVRGGLALGASASYQSTSRLWDLFTFGGTPRREHSLPKPS